MGERRLDLCIHAILKRTQEDDEEEEILCRRIEKKEIHYSCSSLNSFTIHTIFVHTFYIT